MPPINSISGYLMSIGMIAYCHYFGLNWNKKPWAELPSWQIRNEGQKSWKWGTMRDKKIWMRDKMRDIMEHVLKLYSYLYGTCNRHSRLTEGRRRLSSYSFDDQNEFQSSRYPNSLWLKSWGVLVWLFNDCVNDLPFLRFTVNRRRSIVKLPTTGNSRQ